MIQIKRVYEPVARAEGRRFLVDRLWPRGVRKEKLVIAGWCKDAAPSHELRRWFNHDIAKWREFELRYRVELDAHPEAWQPLLDAAGKGPITLLFGARDCAHNHAVILKARLEEALNARAQSAKTK